MTGLERLKMLLQAIEIHDTDYPARYGLVILAMAQAHSMGFAVGVRFDPKEPEYPVFYIELPTGQASWHMPQHPHEWDGHSTEEKYMRVGRFVRDYNS